MLRRFDEWLLKRHVKRFEGIVQGSPTAARETVAELTDRHHGRLPATHLEAFLDSFEADRPAEAIRCAACRGVYEILDPTVPMVDPLTEGDGDHAASARAAGSTGSMLHVRRTLGLIREALENAPAPWQGTYPNDFSSIACFGRAYRQLRAATLALYMGYYTEVPLVLRGAYESASLGRYLAKFPADADRWLREGVWIPDRMVRQAIAGEDDQQRYASFYSYLSQGAHPTAASCLPLIEHDRLGFKVRVDSEFDEDAYSRSLEFIAACGLFVAIALRNSAADEIALPPTWRRELLAIAEDVYPGGDWSRLQRDWESEGDRYEALMARVRDVADLDRVIADDPRSFRRLLEEPEGPIGT